MTDGKFALLQDRGLIEVTGDDAAKLLQNLLTSDIERLAPEKKASHAALLSPQGKILADFLVVKTERGFLLDCPLSVTGDLIKKLTMYKLRSLVSIRDVSRDLSVAVFWERAPDRTLVTPPAIVFEDPRLAALGWRAILPADLAARLPRTAAERDYHAHRIGLGVPEGGRDYAFGDTFPHEALMDQLGGVSFHKGCYVGQEIVSRMEHRGTARKRIVPVKGSESLPPAGTEIRAAEVSIGLLGSTAGKQGLALIRLDRAAEMLDKGTPLSANGIPIKIELPSWARFGVSLAE